MLRRRPHAIHSSFYGYGRHPDLHSFPTRRSSDLEGAGELLVRDLGGAVDGRSIKGMVLIDGQMHRLAIDHGRRCEHRSEEHTSELQSLTNLVCRLLLEKKKDNRATDTTSRGPTAQ